MIRRLVFACIITLIVSLLSVPHASAALTNDQWERRVRYHINQVKERHDLHRVRHGGCVDRRAERWARILDRDDAFYHQSMSKLNAKCNGVLAGEVLARGFSNPFQTVRAWMRSQGHRKVILNGRYRRIGVSARNTPHGKLVVVDFIRH